MIPLFDPSVYSYNKENKMIVETVVDVIEALFPMAYILRIPCTYISTTAKSNNSRSEVIFVRS